MHSLVKTKPAPTAASSSAQLRTAHGNRYCWDCRKKRLKLIQNNGYLTPLPHYRGPVRPSSGYSTTATIERCDNRPA